MKGINHLVLAARDLDALSETWAALGFTLTPRAQHPFGTGNRVIQLHGAYLELLSVTIPTDIVEHAEGEFSFSAFNRDFLRRHEGFSMLVLDTADAHADIASWREAGLQTYAPFEFSRMARLPSGEELRIGFSLAFVSNPAAPWLGHFACQHFRPDYYAQREFMTHPNTAQSIHDVWISGDGALGLAEHMKTVLGGGGVAEPPGRVVFATPTGSIVLATPKAFETAFGTPPPHMDDGPHLAGLTIACESLEPLAGIDLERIGERLVLPLAEGFGTAIGFVRA